MNYYTTSYELSRKLLQYGVHKTTRFYFFKKTRELYLDTEIPKIRNWESLYIPAFIDPELDRYLPQDTVITKVKNNRWRAVCGGCSATAEVVVNAKAILIIELVRAKKIKL